MEFNSRPAATNTVQYFGPRILACVLMLILYFWVLRPLRVVFTEQIAFPQVKSAAGYGRSFQAKFYTSALHITYKDRDIAKKQQYRPEFGFFFLIPLLALFFVTTEPSYYYTLVSIHLAASILGYISLLTGARGLPLGFIGTDIINAYLTPALSLALVPYALQQKSIKE